MDIKFEEKKHVLYILNLTLSRVSACDGVINAQFCEFKKI